MIKPTAALVAAALLLVCFAAPKSDATQIDWIDTLPLHVTALNNCQERLPYANLIVVHLHPGLYDAEIDFRTGSTLYSCRVGIYGGEPQIEQTTTNAPLPERFFTLLPAYPEYECYQHKLIQNYNQDPPEAIGWISTKVC